jgi:predicted transcriptional regulator
MMKARLTYIPVDVADQLDDFIITRDSQILDAVKTRARDFSMLSLLKLLYQLNSGSMNFSDLYTNSKIRMKRSFLNYLHLCVDYNFVTKEPAGSHMIYSITEKGRMMLSMFMVNSN